MTSGPSPIETSELIAAICNSGTKDAYLLYQTWLPLLADYKFILSSADGWSPGFAVNRTFSGGASVRSLFKAPGVLVLDADTVREMSQGRSNCPFDHSIALDTQALSYLEPYLLGRSVPSDFQEVFEFIARDDVNVDPLPYLFENYQNLEDIAAANRVFDKLKAYEILRTLDKDRLNQHGEVRSTLTEYELIARTQQLMSKRYMAYENDIVSSALKVRHQLFYAYLLKMASLQIGSPSISVKQKTRSFLEFCDSDLAAIPGREAIIGRAYFSRGQNLSFFGKVQKGRSNILNQLKNMAWDLLHVRHMEQTMALTPVPGARYFFPAFLTFDKRLIQIMDLYPLRAIAFRIDGSDTLPFFDGDWFDLIASDATDKVEIVERYYSPEAIGARAARRETSESRLPDIVSGLEADLLGVSAT
ncbi:MAG TPA: hypothetical protein VM659_21500 [Dongiaceae bacterium]|nr:hypothetical protein [Dongiaceae bacterium]